MDSGDPYRPRVSRETRLLLITGVLAIATLWVLARIRFQERPVTPNPVPSVLSQLASPPKYDDLAAEIARLRARVQPYLFAIDVPQADRGVPQRPRRIMALAFKDDLAVTTLPIGRDATLHADAGVVGFDPASGLAVIRVSSQARGSPPAPWTPSRLQQPRYLIASDVSSLGVSFRPVFAGSLVPQDSPWWPQPIWALPGVGDLTPGSFIFTNDAELVGMVFAHGRQSVVVPGPLVLSEAERLLGAPPGVPGTIGLEVQDLTEDVAAVTGASTGLVVVWVDPDGAVGDRLMVGDVLETVDGRALETRQPWDVRMARLAAGDKVTLRVRSRDGPRDVEIIAAAAAVPPSKRSLGLALRARSRVGAEVVRVEPATAADRAGLAAGDVITLFAEIPAPTPAQIVRAFASLREGDRVMIAVTRGDAHHVTTLER